MSLATPILSAPNLGLVAMDDARNASTWLGEGFSAEDSQKLAECAEWTATFPLKRVKKRRRVEAICPMVEPSLAAKGMWVSAVNLNEREPALSDLDTLLLKAAATFEENIRTEDPRLRCLILMLPGVRGQRLLDATEPERKIKDTLLKRGILAGEFFPSCPFATTFNPRLFALRSPVPMYVLRTFIETDWRFICQVPKWQETYRERFGEPPAKLRHMGSFSWRMQQKVNRKVDSLLVKLFPERGKEIELD